ncbi:DNA-binding transcriptional regulator, IclR family [Amycolatopsis xylanica]|uniref:DNA-binding transcriptional regulator, IclR family n=1 Tax=Amycolatopsis xylanica TaxID=589385 RepID=A0A1H2V1D2_9PSEU|nr:IclR family transcriptional regulator [Amycolatopsis xylanica]SDW62113.1 DNA-binding transcriptional regulator, IclR family [Amycolatopsis xylanica]
MGGNTREAGRSTANRLLSLLAAFTPAAPVLTLSELARISGLPIATTHRLAGELIEWGALERLADGRFQIGLRLWHVGSLAPGHRDLRSVAMPFMEDLYEATHENVQLAIRDGKRVLYLEKISGRKSVDTMTQVAGRLPLHATGVGKVILAFSGAELFSQVVAEGLARCTPHTITLPGVLAETLEQVRQNQVAFSLEEMTMGASSVAAPIFGPEGTLVAALALVVRSSTNVRPLVAAVRTAALGVTRELSAPLSPGGNLA